jgi:Na+/H+ antiporter NhaD/arsenite permease-like protein
MTSPQIIALSVLVVVVGVLIWGRLRPEVVALAGAAVLLATRTIRPVEIQGAFASPALIALASLFVIAYAMELTGFLGLAIRLAVRLCRHLGQAGIWLLIILSGIVSAFVNNTPIVVLTAPVVRDVARSMSLPARRFLIPLSYATILGGTCTLIGTSTNLLVNDMARNAGQPTFGLFEITPPALIIAGVGALYLILFGGRMMNLVDRPDTAQPGPPRGAVAAGDDPDLFPADRPFKPIAGTIALLVFIAVVAVAAMDLEPIAASAFAGAVFLIAFQVIDAKDAYKGLRPEVLLLIAGMLVIGMALDITGLAQLVSNTVLSGVRVV